MEVKIMKLSERANTPRFAHKGDACFDISVIIDGGVNRPMVWRDRTFAKLDPAVDDFGRTYFALSADESIVFHTGLAFQIPEGHAMLMHVRSSTGIKRGLILSNGTGVIDSGYRGEVHVALTNAGNRCVRVYDGERVAQARIVETLDVDLIEANDLDKTERGTGGIGSTGN